MQEDFLHFLWRFRRFDQSGLQTTQGESILIQNNGEYNTDAGPDFFNAKIQIGNTLWAGNVEMHLLASDWNKHRHQEDAAYDNVILHVVLEEDTPIFRPNGGRIPCLEMRSLIPTRLVATYQKIWHNSHWIACQHHYHQVGDFTKSNWIDRMLIERLETKIQPIEVALRQTDNDWEEVFYRFLMRNFGVKVNTAPFEQLARSLSFKIILKHKNQLKQIEALLFGQAGLLESDFEDAYPQALRQEYLFLQKKHSLRPIPPQSWKFMRMRPANFPTIRLAQMAQLLYQSTHLFSKILVAKNISEIENMLSIQLGHYWQDHYVFDKPSTKRKKRLGKNTIHLIIINTIVPFLFAYGKSKQDETFKDKALHLLETLPPENNSLIKKWQELGQTAEHAGQTQALLHLKNTYCKTKNCLHCGIGNAILKG